MFLIDTGGGGGSPKKKKKKSPPKVVGGTHFSHTKAPVHYSSYTLPKTFHHTSSYSPANTYSRPTPSYTPTYRRPTYSSAPSYSRIVRPPKPKPPTPFEILDSLGLGFAKQAKDNDYTAFKGITRDDNQDEVKAGIFGDFISGVNTGGNSHEPQGDALSQLLMNPLRGKKPQEMYGETPESELSPGMRKFLDSLRGTDKAAPGTVPGMDKMGQNDFAWVPEKFKHLKNGRLKSQWDDQFINSSRGDFAFPSQFEAFLNDMMEAQFRDREKWLLGRNERKYNKIKEVLDDAGQAALRVTLTS